MSSLIFNDLRIPRFGGSKRELVRRILTLLSSTNLLDWQAVTNGTWTSRGASNLIERLRFELPQPHTNAAFFRLQANP